jgi:hypothetical protein
MEDKLIKQLNILKSIKLSDDWKKGLRGRLLIECREKQEKISYYKLFSFNLNWLFQPIPRSALVGVLAIFVMFSLSFSDSISNEDFYGDPISYIPWNNRENNKEIGKNEEMNNKEIGKNEEKESIPIVFLNNGRENADLNDKEDNMKNTNNIDNRENNKENGSYTSAINNNKEITLESFRTDLMEKINRIWVLALEAGNDESFGVASEAEKLFNMGDLDSALRAIMVAEDLLSGQ